MTSWRDIPALPRPSPEVHFFDANFSRGRKWYGAFFPRHLQGCKRHGRDFITGEASPSYLFHPRAAGRVFKTAPEVKVIVLLRDPVSRAYSHYHHEVRLGFETLPFAEAVEKERERLSGEMERVLADNTYNSHNLMRYAYLARGVYIDQVQTWRRLFGDEQILILKSEDFFQDTAAVMSQVRLFLRLAGREPKERGKPATFPYPKMDARMRQYLADYFEPHNQRLYAYLGIDFGWNR